MSEYLYGVAVQYEYCDGDMSGPATGIKFVPGIVTRKEGQKSEGTVLFSSAEEAFEECKHWHNPKNRERAFVYRIQLKNHIEAL